MLKICLSLIILLLMIGSSTSLHFSKFNKFECYMLRSAAKRIQVFITISSVTVSTTQDGIVKRQLEVNWVGGQPSPGDSVGVYTEDPELNPLIEPIISINPSSHPDGYFKTHVELPVIFFNMSCLRQEHCLGYWAAYSNKNGKILSSSCLRIRPFWMEKHSRYLSKLTLAEAMIPGSHDSGSFYFHKATQAIQRYKYTQDESIFSQLIYGLRYFDLRIGYYTHSEEKYYINHNFLRTEHSVKSVLHEVLQFINATKEVVILDFHKFPIGFSQESIHYGLMDIIVRTLGAYLIPSTPSYHSMTFRQLWKENKRVLVSYDSEFRDRRYPNSFWPAIPRAWGNKQHPQDLKRYFEETYKKPRPEGLWASMAELTPNARTIPRHPFTGLRIFADLINRNVTRWFRDLFWRKANIIATDYFLGNNIIDVAIQINKIKGYCPKETFG
ncbi:PI-PLC X domain-containing protein 1-like [Stegodyphus dumicola]|uniref:PI-PLC X domain-containing protein 1-like n=1 Tax=Stegodyphus dumicola TaxID=202533 RepID=UPI0015ACE160|nr:PI-PLC X domain-containing protein 1-like [Stegodyphus dumicola]XP_035223127.1 PI-PLC X domain-containing protein 1-like [Stegodyphus dumicola]